MRMRALVPLPDPRSLRWILALALLPAGIGVAWSQSTEDLQQIQEQIDQGKIEANELKQKADDLAREVARLQQSLIRSAAQVQDAESEATALERELADLSV